VRNRSCAAVYAVRGFGGNPVQSVTATLHLPGQLPSKEVVRNVSRVVLIAVAVAVLALVVGALVGAVIVPWAISSLG
jgi:integral membrane sensor domain MASE1